MNSVLKVTKFQFVELYKWQIVSCVGVLVLNLLISMAIIRLTEEPGPVGGGDYVALIYMPIMGLIAFTPNFKYAVSLGITRKNFFLSGVLSLSGFAAVLAVAVGVIFIVNLQIANVIMLYKIIYHNQYILSLIVWEFAALCFLGMLGWFICMIYYLSNRTVKILVSIAPFVLVPLIMLFNTLVDGAIGRALWRFCKTAMGYSLFDANPYIGTGSLLAGAVIFAGLVYLLVRRAPIKD